MKPDYVGYILEKATIPIEERIASVVSEKVRSRCCPEMKCEGLCNVARHTYRMLWAREWERYVMGN